MIHGIFHGDLHGGNLFVLPDGRVALLDFGITGRMDEPKRRAFLRLLIGATMNDVKGQLAALRDLGALPPDTDLDAVIARPRASTGRRSTRPRYARRADRRDPEGREGAARLRRPAAQGAHAVRQEHGVPRRRHRLAGPRPRPVRRDRRHLDVLRRDPRRAHRRARSASTPTATSSTSTGVKGSFGVDPEPPSASPTASCRSAASSSASRLAEAREHARPSTARLGCRRAPGDRPLLGRLRGPADRPPARSATRLIMVKADGCVAIHADGGAYKPLNWMNAPNRLVEQRRTGGSSPTPRARRSRSLIEEVLSDTAHELGVDPGLQKDGVEAHLQELLAANPDHHRRRADAWCAASTPPTSARSTCSAATPTARPWPSRSSAAARSTASSS